MFFPIMKIIREETRGTLYEYCPNTECAEVEVYLNNEQLLRLPTSIFDSEANYLLSKVNTGSGAFEVARTESFIRSIYMTRLKAPTSDKSDINMQIRDVNTGYENIVGFSIKSELGSSPTLLNAGKTTNFIYRIHNITPGDMRRINAINTRTKIVDRISAIMESGGIFEFFRLENETFRDNLRMIDSQMPAIVAEMLYAYYTGAATAECKALTDYVWQNPPFPQVFSPEFYKHNVREMLCAIALGMKPATRWDGTDEATGGYIIVKTDGDVLAYHIYNRNSFREYLLRNCKLDRASTSKHDFGYLYKETGVIKIKLNLQIRFL